MNKKGEGGYNREPAQAESDKYILDPPPYCHLLPEQRWYKVKKQV